MVFSSDTISALEAAIIRISLKAILTDQDIQRLRWLADIVAMNFNATLMMTKVGLESVKVQQGTIDKKVGLN
jgi:hypothetical protein